MVPVPVGASDPPVPTNRVPVLVPEVIEPNEVVEPEQPVQTPVTVRLLNVPVVVELSEVNAPEFGVVLPIAPGTAHVPPRRVVESIVPEPATPRDPPVPTNRAEVFVPAVITLNGGEPPPPPHPVHVPVTVRLLTVSVVAPSVVNTPVFGVVLPIVPGEAHVLPSKLVALIVPDPTTSSEPPVPIRRAEVLVPGRIVAKDVGPPPPATI
jgi:hypothetical protein